PVKRRQVLASPPVHPNDALLVYRGMTVPGNLRGRSVHFSLARQWRGGGFFYARQTSVVAAPSGAGLFSRMDGGHASTKIEALVFLGVRRRIGLGPLGDFAVAVGIEHGRAPALRGFRVLGLLPARGIQPEDHVVRAEIQEVVGPKLVVVKREAGVGDRCELLRLRVEHDQLPPDVSVSAAATPPSS